MHINMLTMAIPDVEILAVSLLKVYV